VVPASATGILRALEAELESLGTGTTDYFASGSVTFLGERVAALAPDLIDRHLPLLREPLLEVSAILVGSVHCARAAI